MVLGAEAEQEKKIPLASKKGIQVDVILSLAGKIIAVAEVGVSFRGVLSDLHKVHQASAARQAVARPGEAPIASLLITNVENVTPLLSEARASRVRLWQARLNRPFSKCVRDPREMTVLGFRELWPTTGADVSALQPEAWPPDV
jgi:hypothetical protein